MYKLNQKTYRAMYRALYMVRRTEERMCEINLHTPIPELPHSSIGEEAISVGSVFAMKDEDVIIPSLRTRGAFILKGISSRNMMAGSFGKDIPQARGKNTAHHLGDNSCGVLAGTGLIGSHVPAAIGAAFAQKRLKTGGVTTVYFGDGGSNRGDVHEAMNMAAIWNLPVIFLNENNEYAMSTPRSYAQKIKNIADRAAGYGIPGVVVDGMDTIAIYKACAEAFERARKGEGPTLIECKTYRFRGHSEKDQVDNRDPAEVESFRSRDPVPNFRKFILDNNYATEGDIQELEADADAEVNDAVEYAEKAPFPPADILLDNVYEA